MKLLNQYKNILIAFVVLVGGFFLYTNFFTNNDTAPLTAQNANSAETVVEQELISLLLELRSIRLDLTIFDDPRFKSLKDFSQEIIPEPVGRPNPFTPL